MVLGQHPTKPIVWVYAVLLTVLLHVGVVLGAHVLRPFAPSPVPAREPEAIQVVFAPEPDFPPEEPTFFSELPPERASERPEHPDFLSNVDSRASDKTPGGENEGLPTLEGESEAPHVPMESEASQSPVARPEPQAPSHAESTEPSDSQRSAETAAEESAAQDPLGETLLPDEGASGQEETPARSLLFLRSPAETPDFLKDSPPQEAGSEVSDPSVPADDVSDLSQEAMSNPQGNVLPYGDISLNTIAWDYAPWLQEFRRNLVRSWRAPYGYYLGVIHGWTFVELEIARDGELLRMDVLGEQGHESLKNASVGVLRATAPYRALPDQFPEESLILQIKLVYPERKN